jgi:hypothetical protein|tara:strand:+ start:553 stop:978 length:426 start_codon:yes stop_codon:yes gene_type:complete
MNRNIKYKISDLFDKLTVLQLKQLDSNTKYKNFEKTIELIIKEIDSTYLSSNKNFYFDSKIIRLIIILTQINTYIWLLRSEISKTDKSLNNNMKISHQLNALRNIAKNGLSLIFSNSDKAAVRTNTNKEDLKGWKFSLLNE